REMSSETAAAWSTADFCLSSAGREIEGLGATLYDRVCRADFDQPGFCLVDVGPGVASATLRRTMVGLKNQLQRIHRERAGKDLVYVSAGRFDQQTTTKLHRDNGPEENLLMLGYEPSQVPSEVALADYSRCAFEMGITPAEFLERHNPMFAAGADLLLPHVTRVTCFAHASAQIVLVNNSAAPYDPAAGNWQGVLHTATILKPSPELRRAVNSTMIASVPMGAPEGVSETRLAEFMEE
ncbi:MAG TPA: hypothetical protein VNC50_22540, partial [Planctomycetia bacterium]|nr:hypothetical protein [Planctomycetia bacterium]